MKGFSVAVQDKMQYTFGGSLGGGTSEASTHTEAYRAYSLTDSGLTVVCNNRAFCT